MSIADAARCALLAIFCGLALEAPAALPIETWRADSGAKVLFMEVRDLPIIDVSVEFAAGTSRDPRDKAGLARLTVHMMRLGAGSLSESGVSDRLADVGARLVSRLDVDRAGYALRTLSAPQAREAAVSVLEAILAEPAFDAGIFERERTRALAGLREALSRPGTIAERQLQARLYPGHPYGLPASGDLDSLARLTREDLLWFHRQHYVADRAVVAIIGDLSRTQAQHLAQRLTARLPTTSGVPRALPPVPPLEAAVEAWVEHPASQAYLRIGALGLRRGDPDFYALWLANQVLGGGGWTSRLTAELREKRGLTYSAGSYFAPSALEGPFVLVAQTQRAQAAEALAVMRETLRRFVEEGPGKEELEAAKQNVIGGFVLRVDSNEKIHEYLGLIGFYDLPLDYIERFPREIGKLTVQQVREAVRRRIDPARMVTVVVGPPAGG
ncbi:MAG TPA: pitrilysin family protein [Burkholderiales bacterium]|jgi:zinc protease|nr:pitrilysin family protein [Burkholderiales bacterium]